MPGFSWANDKLAPYDYDAEKARDLLGPGRIEGHRWRWPGGQGRQATGAIALHMAAEARTAAHGYSNPEVDRLLNDASKTKDQEKRLEYFNQVQEIFQEELPFITVAYFFILFRTHINLSFASSAQFSVSR